MIENHRTEPVRVRVRAEAWDLGRDGSPVFADPAPSPFSCRDWLRLDGGGRVLEPGRAETVRCRVSVPLGAEPGSYFAAVAVDVLPPDAAGRGGRSLLLKQTLLALVFVRVGRARPQADIAALTLDRSGPAAAARIVVRNKGRSHLYVEGSLDVLDGRGKLVRSVEVPAELVLPESEREFTVDLEGDIVAGGAVHCALRAPSLGRLQAVVPSGG